MINLLNGELKIAGAQRVVISYYLMTDKWFE